MARYKPCRQVLCVIITQINSQLTNMVTYHSMFIPLHQPNGILWSIFILDFKKSPVNSFWGHFSIWIINELTVKCLENITVLQSDLHVSNKSLSGNNNTQIIEDRNWESRLTNNKLAVYCLMRSFFLPPKRWLLNTSLTVTLISISLQKSKFLC